MPASSSDKSQVTRPILPGFYPDPSICRVGDDFYLACSSFEYFPGLPIFHSTDLLTWTQLGNAYDRANQFATNASDVPVEIYAPTLRSHRGKFWIATTNVATESHLIICADDPRGPWSDPVHITGLSGIDPDLAWDENGTCYLTWSSYMPDFTGIAQVPIDPLTGSTLGEPRLLWAGTGLAWPESPHLYRVGQWWYLLIAEGGTERGHVISVARSASIDGPFEGAPQNPIFTHRSTRSPLQNVGHGDLIHTATGEWAMVYLAVRPRGITPGFHVNGRETFLAGITWSDGWPVVDENRFDVPFNDYSFDDDFSSTVLDPRWVSPREDPATWSVPYPGGGLTLHAAADHQNKFRMVAVRTRDYEWTATARVLAADGEGSLVLRLDDDHWCSVSVTDDDVRAVVSTKLGSLELARASRHGDGPLTLTIGARRSPTGHNLPVGPDVLELAFTEACRRHRLGSFDGRYLSTEVAGGFTGRVIGLRPDRGQFTVTRFSYTTISQEPS